MLKQLLNILSTVSQEPTTDRLLIIYSSRPNVNSLLVTCNNTCV